MYSGTSGLVLNKIGGTINVTFCEFDQPEIETSLKRIDAGVWADLFKRPAADVKDVAVKGFWNKFSEPLKPSADADVRTAVVEARNQVISAG